MSDDEAILEYMRSCIRASAPRDVERWDPLTLRKTFLTLPQSFRDFDDWRIRVDGPPSSAPAAPPPPSPEPQAAPLQLSPEDQKHVDEVNDQAIANLAKAFPDFADRIADEKASQAVSDPS